MGLWMLDKQAALYKCILEKNISCHIQSWNLTNCLLLCQFMTLGFAEYKASY